MFKDEVVTCFKILSQHLPGGTKEFTKNLKLDYRSRAESRKCDLPNTRGSSTPDYGVRFLPAF